jgi:glycosidase
MSSLVFAAPQGEFPHPEWSRQCAIYEVNIRQFTPEGTFNAFAQHLPRIKAMGVGLIWLMPIHPIGLLHRKGRLGSYYAVQDYQGINPEFGTLNDFKALVAQAHQLGLKVIIDWVANHTAWDHVWVHQNPNWFKKNAAGEIYPVTFTDGPEPEYWTDVVALDFSVKALWQGMTEVMQYWVTETNIDGFRCDVAGLVPTPFWEHARRELDRIKPMFMLAEWSTPDLHNSAFDMTYDWKLFDVLKKAAKGEATSQDFIDWWQWTATTFPPDAYRMIFTANHDSNSWHGSDAELFGDSIDAMSVLAALLPGMPLLYGGQESRLNKRLEFFEKDRIEWNSFERQQHYTQLLQLKREYAALCNGIGASGFEIETTDNPQVLCFVRSGKNNWLHVQVNLSNAVQKFTSSNFPAVLQPYAWNLTVSVH